MSRWWPGWPATSCNRAYCEAARRRGANASRSDRGYPYVKKEGKTLVVNMFRALMARMTLLVADESGMSTVE